MLRKLISTFAYICHEVGQMGALVESNRERRRFLLDSILYRVMRFMPLPGRDGLRSLRLKGGVALHYRLNRGDIQSIREVWLDQNYVLPPGTPTEIVVDLGANIGLTSTWLAKRYPVRHLIAVEPSPENAQVARVNLEANGIPAQLIEAAVGPADGFVFFHDDAESNLGCVAAEGRRVVSISMPSILALLPSDAAIDVLKVDIEGGEEALFLQGDTAWLERVRSIIIEFHPKAADCPGILARLQQAGFVHLPVGSSTQLRLDYLSRPAAAAPMPRVLATAADARRPEPAT